MGPPVAAAIAVAHTTRTPMNRKQRRAAAKQGNAEALCALADQLVREHKIEEAAKAYRQVPKAAASATAATT